MNIIAFDQGQNFACAMNNFKGANMGVKTHFVFFDGERPHRQGMLLAYLDQLFNDLRQLPGGPHILDAAVYETPFNRGPHATRSGWGIAGVIEACATKAGLPVVDVAVPTIKKFATGHGRAPKEDMIAAANNWGYLGNNEHEADAVCLLKYAEKYLERV